MNDEGRPRDGLNRAPFSAPIRSRATMVRLFGLVVAAGGFWSMLVPPDWVASDSLFTPADSGLGLVMYSGGFFAIAVGSFLFWTGRIRLGWSGAGDPRRRICGECGYDVWRSQSAVCPECGRRVFRHRA